MVRAPPRVLPRSLAPSGVLGGGRSGPGSPLLGLGLWGWRKGVPGGGAFQCCEGRLGSCAPPPATARPLGGLLGSATHVLWARACGCGGPTLSPWPAHPVGAACRGGGGGPSPYLAWGCAPPVGRVRGVRVPGGGLGGGGPPVRRAPRSLCLVPSLCLPWAGNKAGVTGVVLSMGGVAPRTTPVRARPPSLGAICAASWRVDAGSLVPRSSCGSRQLGRGGEPRSGSPLGRGEGGPSPLPRGVGAGAPAACGPVGGLGGGVAPRPPCSPSGWRPAVLYPGPPLGVGALPPSVRVRSGSRGRPGVGKDEGRPLARPPRAPSDVNPPSAPPEWAVVTGGTWGARPPYCSGAPPCAAPKLGPRAAPARWCGLACRPRLPREQAAGGAGARGVRVKPHPPPPPASRSLLGEGGRPLGSGGAEGRSCGPQAGGGERGGGAGGAAPPPSVPPPRRASACHPLSPACPPGVYSCCGGCRAAAGVGRGPVGRQWVSAGRGGEGGGAPPPWFAPPSSPGRPLKGTLRLRRPGRRRSAVGRQRAGRVGACLGRGAPAPRLQRPLRGGCGAAVSSVY